MGNYCIMVQINDRVCLKGNIRTNKCALATQCQDFRDEYFTNICGNVVNIVYGTYTIKLDNGRFAIEVTDDNIIKSSNLCNDPSLQLGAIVCVVGMTNIKASPYSLPYQQKFLNKLCGEVISYKENYGEYYFTVKFGEDYYGSDITCNQFTSFSNEEYNKQRANEVLSHQILYQQLNNDNNNLGINNNDIYINGPNNFLPLVKLEPQNNNTLIYSNDDLNSLNDNYKIKGNYSHLNNDEKFQKDVIKYFKHEILDNWIYDELSSLLNYYKVVDGKVSLVDSLQNLNDTTNNIQLSKLKIEYFKEHFLNKKIIKHVIKQFIKDKKINWYDLKQYNKKLARKFLIYFDEKLRKNTTH